MQIKYGSLEWVLLNLGFSFCSIIILLFMHNDWRLNLFSLFSLYCHNVSSDN